jgi:Tfp pilus assembly pilus retraction ATPase PilT
MLLFMSREYDMTDLLTLAISERADGLSLHAGQPPVVHVRGEAHAIEGPAITPDNADSLLRSLAGTRFMREFRERGTAAFVHSFKDSAQFRVQARLEHDEIHIDLQRLAA